MRIGIVVDEAVHTGAGGIGQSIRNLVESLVQIDNRNEYVLIYASTHDIPPWSDALSNASSVTWTRLPFTRRLLHRLYWPILGVHAPERFTGRLDILHQMSNTTSVPTKSKIIMTVYDVFPELFPADFKWSGRIFRKRLLAQAKGKAAAVIAPSHATARGLSSVAGIPTEKITVIHLGLPARSHVEHVGDEELFSRYNLNQPYLLFVGHMDRRKNIENLIRAYAKLRQERKVSHILVLAGSPGWRASRDRALVKSLGLSNYVRFLGYIPDAYVRPLMRKAELFVFPSLCEGFGFPLLEAMASETPIAASNAFSIPEIGGDAAVYFDPKNPRDIYRVMASILEDGDLQRRLVNSGREQLKLFDWGETARKTLTVYEQVHASDEGASK